jgi:hypothetical protein
MTDGDREEFAPGAADEQTPAEREHPEQQAHGGSMAPGLVDDTGHPTGEVPPTTAQER